MTTDLRHALQDAAGLAWLRPSDDGAHEARRRATTLRRRRRVLIAAGTGMAVALGAVVAVSALRSGGGLTGPELRTIAPAADAGADVSTPGRTKAVQPAESPGGGGVPTQAPVTTLPVPPVFTQSPPPPPGQLERHPGSLAFVRGNDIHLAANSGVTRLTNDPTYERHYPSWSPDGKRLVYARSAQPDTDPSWVGHDQHFDLWVVDVATGAERLLYSDADSVTHPTWLPDGKRIMFIRVETTLVASTSKEWIMDADGSNPEPWEGPTTPTFSPDGRSVAYGCKNVSGLCVADADFGNERVVPDSGDGSKYGWRIAWSPDQRSLAAGTDHELLLVDLDGSHRHRIERQGGRLPTYSPDGSVVVFENGNTANCLNVVDRDGGNLRCLPGDPSDRHPAWSPPKKP